jgi:hypothetical protein
MNTDNGQVAKAEVTPNLLTPRGNLEIPEAEIITPRVGGLLDIPEADLDLGDEEDIGEVGGKPTIGNPSKRVWFVLNPINWSTAWLLQHKEKEDDVEVKWHFVAPDLQKPIKEDLTLVRVIPYISVRTKICRLWVKPVTLGNSWYESLQDKIFRQQAEFFEQYEIRVKSYRAESTYLVSKRSRTLRDVIWPTKKTNTLLAEALGPDRMIVDESHDLYRDLVDGMEV